MVFAMPFPPALVPLMQSAMAQQMGNIQAQIRHVKNTMSSKFQSTKESIDRKKWMMQDKIIANKEDLFRKKESMTKRQQFFFKVAKGIKYFNSQMQMVARFYPIIILVLGIIAIAANLFVYIMMAVAYVAIIFVKIWYFLTSLPPFYQLLFVVWFIIVDFVPFLIYTAIFGALLIIIVLFCCLIAFLDVITGGALKKLALCQNSPGIWYQTPNFQLTNEYSRGLFCSKPCRKEYAPDVTGTSCVRQPRQNPPYCPYAEIMRIYTGVGRKDGKYFYDKFKYKNNIQYLQKSPQDKETHLFNFFMKKKKYIEQCNTRDKRFQFQTYKPALLNICTNIDSYAKENKHGLTEKDVARLRNVCNQAFCSATSSYPFCGPLKGVNSYDNDELIKRIILAIIAIMTVVLIVSFIIYYMGS